MTFVKTPLPSFHAGEEPNINDLQALSDLVGRYLNPPSLAEYQTTGTNLATSGTEQLMLFDTVQWDTDSMHTLLAGVDKTTCHTPGRYFVAACIAFTANATGYRIVFLKKYNSSGSLVQTWQAAEPNDGNVTQTIVQLETEVQMGVGDYLQVSGQQNSGGALASVGTISGTSLFVRKVGE